MCLSAAAQINPSRVDRLHIWCLLVLWRRLALLAELGMAAGIPLKFSRYRKRKREGCRQAVEQLTLTKLHLLTSFTACMVQELGELDAEEEVPTLQRIQEQLRELKLLVKSNLHDAQ